jgi:hypothetical protein
MPSKLFLTLIAAFIVSTSSAQLSRFISLGTGLVSYKANGGGTLPFGKNHTHVHLSGQYRHNIRESQSGNSSTSINLMPSIGGSFGLGSITVGFSSFRYISAYVPLTIEYNIGDIATQSTLKAFGAAVGAGLSTTYRNYYADSMADPTNFRFGPELTTTLRYHTNIGALNVRGAYMYSITKAAGTPHTFTFGTLITMNWFRNR